MPSNKPYVELPCYETSRKYAEICLNSALAGISEIANNVSELNQTLKKVIEAQKPAPEKSTAFPYLTAGFFLLVSAGTYYYFTQTKPALHSKMNAQTQTEAAVGVHTQTNIDDNTIASHQVETPADSMTETPIATLPNPSQGGLFSSRTPSPLSLINTPPSEGLTHPAQPSENRGWFSYLGLSR